jgi:hypothetical protein
MNSHYRNLQIDCTQPTSFEYRRDFFQVESSKQLTPQLITAYSKDRYTLDFQEICPVTKIWIATFSRIVKDN